MKIGQSFKSEVNDEVFKVKNAFSASGGSFYRFQLESKGAVFYVDETGKTALQGLVFRLIDPDKPLLSIELGKTYMDNIGRIWFAYMEQSSGRHRMVRVGRTETITESFFNDGTIDSSIDLSTRIVKELK